MRNLADRIAAQYRKSRWCLYGVLLPLAAATLPGWLDSSMRLILIVLGFSLIIFLHELGHFVVARMCSVKCLAFSLGIGPRMLGWRKGVGLTLGKDPYDPDTKKVNPDGAVTESDLPMTSAPVPHPASLGDCDYRVSWLPLGGYVRMLGQDDMDPTKISEDPHAFNRRPIWQRMCIVSAGVVMNVIFAAVVFSIIFHPKIGVDFPPAVVGLVEYKSPADGVLQMGDEVLLIDGHKPTGQFIEFTDVMIKAALAERGQKVVLTIKRPGVEKPIDVTLIPEAPPEGGFLRFGIAQMPGLKIVRTASVLKEDVELRGKPESEGGQGDPQEQKELAKLKPEDRIVGVDTLKFSGLDEYQKLYDYLQTVGAHPVTLTVTDTEGKDQRTVTLAPKLSLRPGARGRPMVFGMGPRLKAVKVVSGGPAAKAGVHDGDILMRVGDRSWPSEHEFRDIVQGNGGRELAMDVLRDGKRVELKVTPMVKEGKGQVGVLLGDCLEDSVVAIHERRPDTEALAGEGMRIAAVDGQPVDSWNQVFDILKRHTGDQVTFAFAPIAAVGATTGASQATSQIAASVDLAKLPSVTFKMDGDLSKSLATQMHYQLNIPVENYVRTQRGENPWEAMVMGGEHTVKFIEQVYMTLAGLFRGTVSADNLHGIVGITKVGYDVQERGHVWLWYVLALVSVNLAVANFLPLPIVDGGLFLLLIVEKIRGKPLSLKVQSAIQVVGIVLLAGLFLFVTKNDIGMFFTK